MLKQLGPYLFFFFFFKLSGDPRDLPSSPTRPSSDPPPPKCGSSSPPARNCQRARANQSSCLRPHTPPRSRTSAACKSRRGQCRFRRECSSPQRSEEHTSELQSRLHLVCRLLLEKKKR